MIRVALLAAVLMLAPVVGAAVDPHARTSPVQAMPGFVTALAVAGNGAVAAGMNDTGRQVGQPSDVKVWRWWEADGDLVREDRADENNCSPAGAPIGVLDSCIGDVVDLALSSDGSRIAIAARGNNPNEGRILFFHATSGQVANIELTADESPTSLAMSADGTKVAVGFLRPEGTSSDLGRVRVYNWLGAGAGSVTEAWSAATPSITNTNAPVTDVAIGADARVAAIVADRNVRFSATGATLYVHDTDATLNAVAYAAAHGSHWSIAGAQDGGVLVYSDAQDTSSVSAAADIQRGSSPVRAVAFTPNAQAFVSGDAAGIVRAFRNLDILAGDRDIGSTGALDGSVNAIAVSGDGNYLAVAAGRGTYLFRLSTGSLTEVWRHIGTAPVREVGLSNDGSYVASSAGSAVTVFTAVHAVTLNSPASTNLEPSTATLVTLTLRNTGNREEFVPLSVIQKPADWAAVLSVTGLTIAPDATATVTLNVTAPGFAAPGADLVKVRHTVQGLPNDSNVNFQVTQVKRWTVQADGAVNRGIEAGQSTKFPLRVQNLGNGQDTSALTVTVDRQGWTATVDPASLSLAKGATGFANVTLTAPASAANGESAKVAVTAVADPSSVLQLSGTIGARFGVSAAAVPAQASGVRGEQSSFMVRVTNTGNAPDSFRIQEGAAPAGWTLEADDAALTAVVAPGASVDVPVKVTPAANATGATYQLTLTVTSLGDATKQSTATHDVVLGGSQTTTTSKKGKGSPGLEPALLAIALLGVAALLVRKR